MRIGLLVVAALALIGFVVVAVVLPQMAGAKSKEAAEALIAGAQPAKQQIAAIAQKSGALAGSGKGVKLSPQDTKHGNLKWIVEENGAIRGWNEQNALEIALTPSLQAGKVDWRCKGYPVGAMPTGCGGR
jgi:predicted transcriptional regulator